jgi:gamma-glutamylputrescine oxidase
MADTDYPASWYAATRDSSPDRAPLAGRTEADVAVVGGGFAGLHTARLLAMRGLSVVLVERRRIGWGASGRNGGFVGAGFAARSGALIDKLGPDHARRLYAQSQRGVAIVSAAIDELGRPDIRMGSGKLTVSRTDQGTGFADRTRALAAKLGASFEPWDSARVRALIDSERYHQAIHDPQSFHIHPLNLALALAGDIERRGGAVHERTEATGLERQGRPGACVYRTARSRHGTSCWRAMPISDGCSRASPAPSCRWRPMSP